MTVRNHAPRRWREGRAPALALFVAAGLALGACQTNQQGGQTAGAGLGAVLGALAGNEIGGTKGAVIGGLIGAFGGYLIGGEIGRYLDERDRQVAAENTLAALETSQAKGGAPATASWRSPENDGVSGAATATAVGGDCYSVQEVAVIPGRGDVRQETRYCERNGQWVAV